METKVVTAEKTQSGVKISTESVQDGAKATVEADVVLVAIGRRAFTKGLSLENVGIVVSLIASLGTFMWGYREFKLHSTEISTLVDMSKRL